MNKIYSLLVLLISTVAMAQVADISVTDCNSTTSSIHTVLGSGKALLVASEGYDCGICQSKAAGLEQWASQNPEVEVWGAMTFTYSSNTPSCADNSQWVSTYGWSHIFSFIDANEEWFAIGTPRYFVYDPKDSSLAYEGLSESDAQNMAVSLSNVLSEDKKPKVEKFFVGQGQGFITLNNIKSNTVKYSLYSITGTLVKSEKLNYESGFRINTAAFKSGIYILKVKTPEGFEESRKVILR